MIARSILAKILPSGWLPYLLHLRPRAWLIVTAHMSVGFWLANGLNLAADKLQQLGLAALAWGVLGNGGTLAINSAFDRDEGDIGYLDDPPRVPRHLVGFALAMLAAGWLVATRLGAQFIAAYSVCCALSLLYSVPPLRFKAIAGLDVLINSIGYGAMTLYAGWAAVGRPLVAPILNVVAAFFFLFAGFYPLTQIYQMGEDTRRGDRTLATALGKRNVLTFAVASIALGFLFLFREVTQNYWQSRSLIIGVALALWMLVLVPWVLRWKRADLRYEQLGMYRALWAWAVTDIGVVIAMLPL
jgi:4-hydroxybenzoate polyprenyltransferase